MGRREGGRSKDGGQIFMRPHQSRMGEGAGRRLKGTENHLT